jgi:N-acylneuraminate cytidylyltransferase
MNRIAILPAKLYSRRIKNKNITKFFGKHIIEYTIINLIKSRLFKKIHISTDSKIIEKISEKYNIKIDFFRTKELCEDHVSLNDVMKHVLERYMATGKSYDTVCLAYATAPLLDHKDFILACKKFEQTKLKYPLLSVGKYRPSISMAMKMSNNIVAPLNKKFFFQDTKKNKDLMYDTGSFMFFTPNHLFKKKKSSKYYFYKLPFEKSIDIDNLDDLKVAKKLFIFKK